MGEVIKRLGAKTVVANTDTQLYTTPANTQTAISKVVACNRGGTDRTIRVAHVDGAIGAVTNEDYIVHDVPILANRPMLVMESMGMEAADTILVRANHADVNFIAWGSELS